MPSITQECIPVCCESCSAQCGPGDANEMLSDTFRYIRRVRGLPGNYTHVVVVVKFGYTRTEPPEPNNFVLTAYLVERGDLK